MNSLRRLFFPTSRRPPRPPEDMRAGALYFQDAARGAAEFARIIDIGTDKLGASHIRFELIYRYRHKTMSAGERTLALATFRQRFPRRIADDEPAPV